MKEKFSNDRFGLRRHQNSISLTIFKLFSPFASAARLDSVRHPIGFRTPPDRIPYAARSDCVRCPMRFCDKIVINYCCPLKLFIIFTSPFYTMRYNLYILSKEIIMAEKCVCYIRKVYNNTFL